jgi:hypothetical protein
MNSQYNMALPALFDRADCSSFFSKYMSANTVLLTDLTELVAEEIQHSKAVTVLIHEKRVITQEEQQQIDDLVEKRILVRVQRVKIVEVQNDDQASELLGCDFDCIVFGVCGNKVSRKVFDNVTAFHDSVFLVRPKKRPRSEAA